MVEESTAAAHALKGEAKDLTTMVGRFEIGGEKRRDPARNKPVHKAQASIANGMNAAPRRVRLGAHDEDNKQHRAAGRLGGVLTATRRVVLGRE